MFIAFGKKHVCIQTHIMLICLLIVGSFAHGAVLCIGSDGHVSLEYGTKDCCDEDLNSGQNSSAFGADLDSCLDCVDIPLLGNCKNNMIRPVVTKKSSFVRGLKGITIPVTNYNHVMVNMQGVEKSSDSIANSLSSIRTTVLII